MIAVCSDIPTPTCCSMPFAMLAARLRLEGHPCQGPRRDPGDRAIVVHDEHPRRRRARAVQGARVVTAWGLAPVALLLPRRFVRLHCEEFP